jgi:tRNA(Ile)-lysidine synthase
LIQPKDSTQQKVLAFIRENRLLKGGQKIVVAVSGGPDSVCLLHILHALKKELGVELFVAHLNHQLRGAESDADAAYVSGLARRLKIPAVIESSDVRSYQKKHKLTLEEAAREVRYRFLASIAQKTGAQVIAAGHTADDHVETILMHLVRGSGIKGLRGLRAFTQQNISGAGFTIIRPLLGLSREETTGYCREHGLKPRLDSSNLSLEPFRNKVRHILLPELRKYNPRISEAFLRTAATAAADLDFIENEARLAAPKVSLVNGDSVILDKKTFLALHPAIQRQLLRDSIETLLGSLKDIEAGHIEDMIEALGKPAGKIIGLPFALNFYIDYGRYILAPDITSECPLPELKKEFSLTIPGKASSSGWEAAATYVTRPAETKDEGGFTAFFDASTVAAAGKKLKVRGILPGDRFQPLGMEQEKKLNRFMTDEKIPRAWRNHIPLVCSGGEIIWVVGYRISELYRVKPETKKVLKLEFKKT